MDNLSTTPRRIQQSPDLSGQARVDLRQRDFDSVVWGKAYDVFIDKSIKCPCRNKPDHQAQVNCRNCGGIGYVFLNRIQTRAVVQSLNLDTKFKEWSKELVGMVKMTFLNKERISFMDRVTIVNAVMLTDQVLFPKLSAISSKIMSRSIYSIIYVDTCFLYIDNETRLRELVNGVDYTIEEGQYFVLDPSLYVEGCTVSIRYFHHPAYHVIDIPRAVMQTPEFNKDLGQDVGAQMPLLANMRLSHFVLDLDNYNGDWLFNNSTYSDSAKEIDNSSPSYGIDIAPVTTTKEDVDTLTSNIEYYRSDYNSDGYVYSGYLLNGVVVIKRQKDNITQSATNLTQLESDWANRLSLIYV